MQSGNSMQCCVDAAGQLNSMLDPLKRIIRSIGGFQSLFIGMVRNLHAAQKKTAAGCGQVNLDGDCWGMYNVITERGGSNES